MPKPKPPRLLFGPYSTPRFRYGRKIDCEVRGEVIIVGLSDGRIPWPLGYVKGNSNRALIVYGALAKAVRTESAVAVCYWWGVTAQTISKWRGVMGVGSDTDGSRELRREHGKRNIKTVGPRLWSKAHDPERAAKIAAAKRGKSRPPHVIEAMRKANIGRKLSAAHRAKLVEVHRRRARVAKTVVTKN
jgi:hypothetical protein